MCAGASVTHTVLRVPVGESGQFQLVQNGSAGRFTEFREDEDELSLLVNREKEAINTEAHGSRNTTGRGRAVSQ